MKVKGKRLMAVGLGFLFAFAVFTVFVVAADVKPIGVNSTNVGLADLNSRFHSFTGVDMLLYTVTDWLGLIPLFVCFAFGVLGFVQLIKRKSILKVDRDILFLGVYYVIVILCYFVFETIPINYRPVLINGKMEVSYPSSTTLLVLAVMPTLVFQINKRLKRKNVKSVINTLSVLFSAFMVVGRLVSGVHWFTDIVGSVLLSFSLFFVYKSVVLLTDKC